MITNKPHSSEDVLVQETDAFGQKVFRFTDAWYNYFNSVDTEFNVTVTQNITNISSSGSQSFTSSLSWEVADLDRKISNVIGSIHEPAGDIWELSERVRRLESRDNVHLGHHHQEIDELQSRLRQMESLIASLMGADNGAIDLDIITL